MSKKIHCHNCNRYVGEIRDAKLAKGLTFNCAKCTEPEKNVFERELDRIKSHREFLDGLKRHDFI